MSNQLLNIFSKHFVVLQLDFDLLLQDRTQALYSGFVVEVDGEWFWISAGHILEEIFTATDKGATLAAAYLIDLGKKTPWPLPFNFIKAFREHFVDPPIDMAVIHIDHSYRKPLASNGLVPLSVNTICSNDAPADQYFLMGVPEQFNRFEVHQGEPSIEFVPVVIYLERQDDEEYEEGYPRLVFNCAKNLIHCPIERLSSIVGMSGGPIFAIRKREDGTSAYACVAIQSSWIPTQQRLFATPLDLVANYVSGRLKIGLENAIA